MQLGFRKVDSSCKQHLCNVFLWFKFFNNEYLMKKIFVVIATENEYNFGTCHVGEQYCRRRRCY